MSLGRKKKECKPRRGGECCQFSHGRKRDPVGGERERKREGERGKWRQKKAKPEEGVKGSEESAGIADMGVNEGGDAELISWDNGRTNGEENEFVIEESAWSQDFCQRHSSAFEQEQKWMLQVNLGLVLEKRGQVKSGEKWSLKCINDQNSRVREKCSEERADSTERIGQINRLTLRE